jgi:hypothetical protein
MLPDYVKRMLQQTVIAQNGRRAEERARLTRELKLRRMGRDGGACSADVTWLHKQLAEHLDANTRFVWTELSRIVSASEIQPSTDLSLMLKAEVLDHVDPAFESARTFLRQFIRSIGGSAAYYKNYFDFDRRAVSEVNSEIDFFCQFTLPNARKTPPPRIIVNITGDNARFNLNSTDQSSNETRR